MSEGILEIDDGNFESEVLQSDKPVLVDFWAPWCGPCLAMAPAFEEAASILEPKVRLAKLNTEDEQMIGGRLGIRSIPTSFLVGPDGKVVHRWVGVHGRDEYEKEIRKVLGMES